MSLKSMIFRVFVPCLLLFGCGAMPASGPQGRIGDGASVRVKGDRGSDSNFDYAVVEFSASLMRHVSERIPFESKISWPTKVSPEIIKVSVGDTIQVTIYEAQSGGLFIPKEAGVRPGNYISLPPQTVEHSGYITVPYVGLVKASDRTTVDIGASIANSLSDRAIEPQVVVSFSDRGGSEVSIIGAVGNAKRFALSFGGDKILDAIASAGGASSPGYETWVSLIRGDDEYQIPFDELILDPKKNIYVQSNDTIYLYREAEIFTVYGAAENQGVRSFGKRDLLLSEALGLVNGLNDTQADPAEIYIYRHEDTSFLSKLTDDITDDKVIDTAGNATVPVIYKLDLRDPNGFFWAQRFPMNDDDVIYVANARSVEFLKFVNILNRSTSVARSVKSTKNAY